MLKMHSLSPPLPGSQGAWVPRKCFPCERSFAHFACPCGARWKTGAAWRDLRQRCFTCRKKVLPWVMWLPVGVGRALQEDRGQEEAGVESRNADYAVHVIVEEDS